LEVFDDGQAVSDGHRAVQPRPVEAGVGEERLEDGEEAGELADHDRFVARTFSAKDLLKTKFKLNQGILKGEVLPYH